MGTQFEIQLNIRDSLIENFIANKDALIYRPAGTNRDEGQTASYTDVAPYIPAETTNTVNAERDILSNSQANWEAARRAYKPDPNGPGALAGFISYMANLSKRSGALLIRIHKELGLRSISKMGDPGSTQKETSHSSQYNSEEGEGYKSKISLIEGSGVDPPNQQLIRQAAQTSSNLGQLLGPIFGQGQFAKSNYFGLTETDFRLLYEDDFSGFINNSALFASQGRNRINGEIINAYLPSFNRIEQPTPVPESLDAILQQNLLLPGDNPNATDVFRNSYINNRGKTRISALSNGNIQEGVIGGVPVSDIKEGLPDREELFTFEQDAARLHPRRQELGFIQNINVDGSASLQPAVASSDPTDLSNHTEILRILREKGVEANINNVSAAVPLGLTQKQFFPFMFETENRDAGGEFKQYCFLQATLNQLQESYQPTWSSKSFFGRTEKIHTYSETERVLDIQFVIFANSMRELQNVYERSNWLAQQCYGSHETDNNGNINRIKTGPLVRMTIGDMFQRVPGFIRNLSFNWDFGGPGGKWELTQGLKMPVIAQVSLSYQVIHASLPDRDFDFYWGMQGGIQDRDNLIPTVERDNLVNENYVDLLKRKG